MNENTVYIIWSFVAGTLCFAPGEVEKSFSLIIIDDDIFEEDEHFECKLSNVRLNSANGKLWIKKKLKHICAILCYTKQ